MLLFFNDIGFLEKKEKIRNRQKMTTDMYPLMFL